MNDSELFVELQQASKLENISKLTELLTQSHLEVVMNRVGSSGRTLLADAIIYRRYGVARLLASAGACIDPEYEAEHANELRLWTAVLRGDLDELRRRIDAGDSVDQAPQGGKAEGWTALWLAMKLEHAYAARMLIQAGADVNAADNSGRIPLIIASENGNFDMARVLIGAGADVNAADMTGRSPLLVAVLYNHLDIVKLLAEAKANVNAINKRGEVPLHVASRRGNLDMVKVLIDAGADANATNKDGMTPLHDEALNGCLETAKFLIEHGADVHLLDRAGKSPLHYALSSTWQHATSFREMFTLLTDAGATIDGATTTISPLVPSDVIRAIVPEDTPFWLAANNDAPMLAAELAGGLDPNMKTENGMTLLHWACAGDAPECVQLLLDAGTESNIRLLEKYGDYEYQYEYEDDFVENLDGDPLLAPAPIYYCMHESSACLKCMIDYGADVNQSSEFDDQTKCPIHLALAANSPACVTALVGAGAWVTEEEMGFNKPLESPLLIRPVPVDALRALLAAAGERVLSEKIDDKPPLYWAVENSTVDGVRVLVEGGADVNEKYKNVQNITFNVLEFVEERFTRPFFKYHVPRLTAIIDYIKSLSYFSEEQ